MHIAHQFGREDVDAFLDGITAEQYAEWCAFFAVEPQGWRSLQIAIQKITFVTARAYSPKSKERDFAVRLQRGFSADIERVRWEAYAVQQEVAANLAALAREAEGE